MDDNFEGVKVMVVDDRKTIRRRAKTLLSKVGCEVVTAMDGFDALAKIADTQPAIIFVDIMMPLSSARSISNKRLSLVLIDFWGNLSRKPTLSVASTRLSQSPKRSNGCRKLMLFWSSPRFWCVYRKVKFSSRMPLLRKLFPMNHCRGFRARLTGS